MEKILVVLNPNDFSLEQIQTKINKKLISGEFFYPEESGIEKFDFHKYCDDYSRYEFDFLENVSGPQSEKSIEEFISGLNKGKPISIFKA